MEVLGSDFTEKLRVYQERNGLVIVDAREWQRYLAVKELFRPSGKINNLENK